jgi:hypothetical protein
MLPCPGTPPQMYLTDVEEGGETVFPHVPKLANQTAGNGWSDCALKVRVPCNNRTGLTSLPYKVCKLNLLCLMTAKPWSAPMQPDVVAGELS